MYMQWLWGQLPRQIQSGETYKQSPEKSKVMVAVVRKTRGRKELELEEQQQIFHSLQ
jgi:hypothetical protein